MCNRVTKLLFGSVALGMMASVAGAGAGADVEGEDRAAQAGNSVSGAVPTTIDETAPPDEVCSVCVVMDCNIVDTCVVTSLVLYNNNYRRCFCGLSMTCANG